MAVHAMDSIFLVYKSKIINTKVFNFNRLNEGTSFKNLDE